MTSRLESHQRTRDAHRECDTNGKDQRRNHESRVARQCADADRWRSGHGEARRARGIRRIGLV